MTQLIEARGGKGRQGVQDRREMKEKLSTASLQLRIDPDRVPWVFAALEESFEKRGL